MAIEFNEDHVGRGGVNAGADDNSDTRSWWVKTDDRQVVKTEIEQAGWSSGTLPRPLLDSYPGNPFMICKSLETRQQDDKGPFIWRCTARYDTKPIGKEQKEKQEQPDPLLRSAVYSGGFERDQKTKVEDVEGNVIKNSAGDPFLEPVLVPRTRMRIKGRMNVPPDAIPSWFFELKDKTNENTYVRGGYTFPEQTLLFIPGEISEPDIENGVEYITIHWELEYREETWKERRLDNGFNELIDDPDNPGEKKKVPIEVDGARPTEPQLLHDGKRIAQSSIDAGLVVFLEWETIETASFSVLP
jgi:hypothetical protein